MFKASRSERISDVGSIGKIEKVLGRKEKIMCKVYSVSNQKGGVSKTATCVNLGIGLARAGKKVCLIDADAQGSLTESLGLRQPDELDVTLGTVLGMVINEEDIPEGYGIIHHPEGVDLLPGNIELAGLEVSLVNVMSRETILRQYIEIIRDKYDYIIIDCTPSLGMLTINALACADAVIIPCSTSYLSAKGLEQLIMTISKIRKQLNRNLHIEGILLSMVDKRTNYAKDIITLITETYGEHINIFKEYIPFSVRAAEASAEGVSIFLHDPRGKVAKAYEGLTKEVLGND